MDIRLSYVIVLPIFHIYIYIYIYIYNFSYLTTFYDSISIELDLKKKKILREFQSMTFVSGHSYLLLDQDTNQFLV